MSENKYLPQDMPEGKGFDELSDGEYWLPEPIEGSRMDREGRFRREPSTFKIVVIRSGKVYGFREDFGGYLHIPPREEDAGIDFDVPDVYFPPIA